MIVGIGVDIVQVSRVRSGWERYGERYAQRILSESEYADFKARRHAPVFIASRFAAKEAFVKALGTGFRDGVVWRDVSVTHDPLGRPLLDCSGRAGELLRINAIDRVHLSLSDEIDYAVAFVTLERTR
jgi:holo-[acyl-carrier protein] synthase